MDETTRDPRQLRSETRVVAKVAIWIALVTIALCLLGSIAGCKGSPTALVPDCPFKVIPAPLSGFVGIYLVTVDPPGAFAVSVNGLSRAVEGGGLLAGTAKPGDTVQACRPSGCCTENVVIR